MSNAASTTLYNPALLERRRLIDLFVAREPLLARLVEVVATTRKTGPPQHHLLIGERGTGKTTLLTRLGYAVEDTPSLGAAWLPLFFPEEQYNARSLTGLWINGLRALQSSLPALGEHELHDEIDTEIANLSLDARSRSAAALTLLLQIAKRLGRRLLLLIDNLDLLLRFWPREDAWALREVLSKRTELLVVASMRQWYAFVTSYDSAFFDFFQLHRLAPLTPDEAVGFIRRLAERLDLGEVSAATKDGAMMLRVVAELGGGNLRWIVALFRAASAGTPSTMTLVERLVDELTPLYQARLMGLSARATQVVCALAERWSPTKASDLAADLGLTVNFASAQLNRLVGEGMVSKLGLPTERRLAFMLADRIFNIWYLIRSGSEGRDRVRTLLLLAEHYSGRGSTTPLEEAAALSNLTRAFQRPPAALSTADHSTVHRSCRSLVARGIASRARQCFQRPDIEKLWMPLPSVLDALVAKERDPDIDPVAILDVVAPEARPVALAMLDLIAKPEPRHERTGGRIKLDGPESKLIREALISAYDPISLQPLVRHAAPAIVNSIQWLHPGGIEMIALDVIERANQHGVLDRLLSAMAAERPHRPVLRALTLHFSQREGWSVPVEEHGMDLSRGGLERLTSSGDPFLDATHLATWLIDVERQVCQVQCGDKHGSGFLVGPDLVLTCYHVVERYLAGAVEAGAVRVRFDYRRDAQGATPAYESLKWVAIDPSFETLSSPYSQADIGLVGEPAAEELDYALLKLASKVGDEQLGAGGKRGWVDLSRETALPPAQAPVLIVQHPSNDSPPPPQLPLQITFAAPGYDGLNAGGTRVRYKAGTRPGSSGSPVYGPDLTPIALHHNRGQIDPAAVDPDTEHRGIPLSRIRQALLSGGVQLVAP